MSDIWTCKFQHIYMKLLISSKYGYGIAEWFHCQLNAEDAQLTPVLRLGAGACAGIIAMSATYPMDMVRGRITVQVMFQVSSSALLSLSVIQIIWSTWL